MFCTLLFLSKCRFKMNEISCIKSRSKNSRNFEAIFSLIFYSYMKQKFLNVLAVLLFFSLTASAQQFAIGLNLGATGFGPDVAVNFGQFGARLGYSALGLNGTYKNLTIPLSGVNVTGDVAATLKASRINLLAEYGGIFRVFAGLSVPTASKELLNATFTTTQSIKIAGYEIKPDPKTGAVGLAMGYKNSLQPVIGISLGRAVPNKRVGFGIDLGAIFTGNYEIQSLKSALPADLEGLRSKIAAASALTNIYPIANIRISVRLNGDGSSSKNTRY
jgi:hypothetical protein